MRILHVYNHFYPCVGGIERHIEDLCINLIRLGHASDVCCLNTCGIPKKTLKPREKYKGINIYRIPYKDLKYYKVAPEILKKLKKYDVIHVHGIGFFLDFLSSTKRIHKKPLVMSTHGGIFHTKKILPIKKLYFNLWSRHKLKNVDRVIAVSRSDEKLFSKISKNTVFIPNGIDFETYSKIKRKPEKNTLIFLGRFSSNKRIDHLIEMTYFLKEKIPGIKLYLVGVRKEKKLEIMIKRKNLTDNVMFIGFVSEKEKLNHLKRAEIFVSASEYEGFGISVLEAMAAGVPVVLNDIDAFNELVENGENGIITDFTNPQQAAKEIYSLDKRMLSNISKNAKKSAGKYDHMLITKRIEKIYKESL